jgi:hypothetical protein
MLGFVATAPLIDVFSKLAAQAIPVGRSRRRGSWCRGSSCCPSRWSRGAGCGMPWRLIGPLGCGR